MRKAHWGECFDSDLNEGRLAEDQGEQAVSLMWNLSRKQFSAKNLSSGCCGYKDGPGGCGLFSLTVGVYEDTMEVVCMRSEREKLHFLFKHRQCSVCPGCTGDVLCVLASGR